MIRLSDAACRGCDPKMFEPPPKDYAAIDAARQICARCPIRRECLRVALATPDTQGIWGGLTTGERARFNPQDADAARNALEMAARKRNLRAGDGSIRVCS